jgi:hypothetical protein
MSFISLNHYFLTHWKISRKGLFDPAAALCMFAPWSPTVRICSHLLQNFRQPKSHHCVREIVIRTLCCIPNENVWYLSAAGGTLSLVW